MTLLRLLLLPFRAPMLLVLMVVSAYLGLNWSTLAPQAVVLPWLPGNGQHVTLLKDLVMPLECLQAVAVVVICTVPDLLLRELSFVMARSKVLTLIMTLFLVITGGVYLMHLNVLTDVLLLRRVAGPAGSDPPASADEPGWGGNGPECRRTYRGLDRPWVPSVWPGPVPSVRGRGAGPGLAARRDPASSPNRLPGSDAGSSRDCPAPSWCKAWFRGRESPRSTAQDHSRD